MIEQQVVAFINSERLFTLSDKILVTLSGGTDSVAMTALLLQLGYTLEAAHCNFQLRGREADDDEAFVRKLCKQWGIPLQVQKFNTQQYADKQKISIQMAARDLRYTWFEQVREERRLDYIAIAHNQDDAVETFFLNLSRGAGLKGLTGIAAKHNKIVRPLLNTWRKDLTKYLATHTILFREDRSNAETKYQRNLIRHEILPLMERLNPAFGETMQATLQRLNEAAFFYQQGMEAFIEQLVTKKADALYIKIAPLLQHPAAATVLHELLTPAGFTHSQQQNILSCLSAQPGKQFASASHKVVKDRNHLIVSTKKTISKKSFPVDLTEKKIKTPIALQWQLKKAGEVTLSQQPAIAYLDAEKLASRLTLRGWQAGDKFIPLGMSQFKKISDFLIDNKVPRHIKEQVYVLESNGEICWVVGMRIDDRFKLTETTQQVLVVELTKKNS